MHGVFHSIFMYLAVMPLQEHFLHMMSLHLPWHARHVFFHAELWMWHIQFFAIIW